MAFDSSIESLAMGAGGFYVGLDSSRVYKVAEKDFLEQRFGGGPVVALAYVSGQLIAVVEDAEDATKGVLYHLGGEGLDVLTSEPVGAVGQLVEAGEGKFLFADDRGLWVGRTFLDKMATDLEIEGAVKLSRNSHDGYVAVSTGSATRLMRFSDRGLVLVKSLSRGGIIDAAFSENLLAVVYEAAPRQVALYRIE
jgi:hypothetical protein